MERVAIVGCGGSGKSYVAWKLGRLLDLPVLSLRRRGIVLTDLAMVGVQRRDPDHLVVHAEAAVDTARQTGSGVVARKLQGVQAHLGPFLGDGRVRHLDKQITVPTRGSVSLASIKGPLQR